MTFQARVHQVQRHRNGNQHDAFEELHLGSVGVIAKVQGEKGDLRETRQKYQGSDASGLRC